MSKIPDTERTKYNHNDPFRWVDSQWEKFMIEQKELKARIRELEKENAILKGTYRGDEWRVEQWNRNRDTKDQVRTVEELEKAISKVFK